MKVETLDARNLSEADAQLIAELLVRVWPDSKTVDVRRRQMIELGLNYTGPDAQAPRSFLIREAGKVIAHSAILPRTVGAAAGELVIAGLTRVCTDADQRGRGLGELVVRAVFDLVDQGFFMFSLLHTTLDVRPFYEKLGCCTVENPIINSLTPQEHESPFWDKEIMRYPATGDWPTGEIDLRGPGY
jgi:predicted N-acetyltransferase YhbS